MKAKTWEKGDKCWWMLAALTVLMILSLLIPTTGRSSEGDEKADAKAYEVSFSSEVFSRYVGDTGMVYYNNPVIQNELTIEHASGLYFDLWVSTSLKDAGKSTNYGNEINYTLGWSKEVSSVTIDAGITYFDIITLLEMPEGDIVQPFVEIGKSFEVAEGQTLTPSIKAEYGIPARGNDVVSKGLHVHSALAHSWEVSEKFSLINKATLSYDDGAYGADRALIGAYNVSPSYKVASWLSLDGSVELIGPLTHVDDGREAEFVLSVGLTTGF